MKNDVKKTSQVEKKRRKESSNAGSAPTQMTYTKQFNLGRPPTDTASIFNLGLDLLEWCQYDNSLRIEQFPIARGYTPSRFFKLAEVNENFAACLEIARETIGIRLQLLAQDRKIDKDTMLKILPLYNQLYRDLQNERYVLATKALQKEAQSPIAVYIDSIKVGDEDGKRNNTIKNI